jgi:hypothetical protein
MRLILRGQTQILPVNDGALNDATSLRMGLAQPSHPSVPVTREPNGKPHQTKRHPVHCPLSFGAGQQARGHDALTF